MMVITHCSTYLYSDVLISSIFISVGTSSESVERLRQHDWALMSLSRGRRIQILLQYYYYTTQPSILFTFALASMEWSPGSNGCWCQSAGYGDFRGTPLFCSIGVCAIYCFFLLLSAAFRKDTEYVHTESHSAAYSSRIKNLDKPAYNYTSRNNNNQPVGFGGMLEAHRVDIPEWLLGFPGMACL